MRTRYALCGLSNRGLASFALPLLGTSAGTDSVLGYGRNDEDFSDHGDLVAVMDTDAARMSEVLQALGRTGSVAAYTDVDELLDGSRPDVLIVTSPDHTHEGYVLAALAKGVRVIVEKPMTSTAAGASRVLAAEAASSADVRVTHNLRYTARHRQIKAMLDGGAIGRVLHVNLDYHVDTRHGASYFLRWNRQRSRSGGLSVHKSTHHLDLVSWWLGQEPQWVRATGGLDYYGPRSPHAPRDGQGHPLTGDALREADPYYRAQLGSGAFPDGAASAREGLFGLHYYEQYPAGRDDYLYDEVIDIEDHYAALVGYPDASLSYSISFSAPWEGYRLSIVGTHGQIETMTGRLPDGTSLPGTDTVTLRPLFAPAQQVTIEQVLGGHEGADPLMRRDLFIGPSEESLRQGMVASSRAGAVAVAAGEALWRSVREGRTVTIAELLS